MYLYHSPSYLVHLNYKTKCIRSLDRQKERIFLKRLLWPLWWFAMTFGNICTRIHSLTTIIMRVVIPLSNSIQQYRKEWTIFNNVGNCIRFFALFGGRLCYVYSCKVSFCFFYSYLIITYQSIEKWLHLSNLISVFIGYLRHKFIVFVEYRICIKVIEAQGNRPMPVNLRLLLIIFTLT